MDGDEDKANEPDEEPGVYWKGVRLAIIRIPDSDKYFKYTDFGYVGGAYGTCGTAGRIKQHLKPSNGTGSF